MCGFLTCYEVQLSSLNTKRFLGHPRKNFHQMRCPLQNIIRIRNQPRKKLHNTFTNICTEQLDELEISIACYLTKTKPLSTITHRNRERVIWLFQYKSTRNSTLKNKIDLWLWFILFTTATCRANHLTHNLSWNRQRVAQLSRSQHS